MTGHTPTYTEVSDQANVHVLARIQRTESLNSNTKIRQTTCVRLCSCHVYCLGTCSLLTNIINHLTTYKTKKEDFVLTNVPKHDLEGMKRLGKTKQKHVVHRSSALQISGRKPWRKVNSRRRWVLKGGSDVV